jgi:hypothetical protein
MKTRTAIIGAAIALILVAWLGWLIWQFFGDAVREYLNRRPFDSAAWQAAPGTTVIDLDTEKRVSDYKVVTD